MNPVEDAFLSLLRCPRTGGELALAGAKTLEALNESAREGKLANASGTPVEQTMEAALVSACGRWLYPVREGIPVLLAEEALSPRPPQDRACN